METNIHEFNSPAHFRELGEGLRKIADWIESGEGDIQYLSVGLQSETYTVQFDRLSPTSAKARLMDDSNPFGELVFTASRKEHGQ